MTLQAVLETEEAWNLQVERERWAFREWRRGRISADLYLRIWLGTREDRQTVEARVKEAT